MRERTLPGYGVTARTGQTPPDAWMLGVPLRTGGRVRPRLANPGSRQALIPRIFNYKLPITNQDPSFLLRRLLPDPGTKEFF
jgi:hypothetical protein